jgi:hypothetical protein
MQALLDIYTDYLISSTGQTSAVGLARLLDGEVSHDAVTRLLKQSDFGSKALWQLVKPLARSHECADGCLVFDDTIAEKPHSQENDLVTWHYDHSKGRTVKGINLLTAFYITSKTPDDPLLRMPVAYELTLKPEVSCSLKTRQVERKSPVTKNEQLRAMFSQCIHNQLVFRYVLADSWFGSVENMVFIADKKKYFIFDMKVNRLAILTSDSATKPTKNSSWTAINDLEIPDNTPVTVWLKDLDFPVLLIKQVFINEGDTVQGIRFLVSNDLNLTYEHFVTIYKKRWGVEEYHKSLKQNASFTKSPAKVVKTQSNHVFCSICAFVKLEKLKIVTGLNHFQLKAKLYYNALQAAYSQLQALTKKLSLA